MPRACGERESRSFLYRPLDLCSTCLVPGKSAENSTARGSCEFAEEGRGNRAEAELFPNDNFTFCRSVSNSKGRMKDESVRSVDRSIGDQISWPSQVPRGWARVRCDFNSDLDLFSIVSGRPRFARSVKANRVTPRSKARTRRSEPR